MLSSRCSSLGCNPKDSVPYGPSIGGVHSSECSADLKECLSGHEMVKCPGNELKFYCQQCSDLSFQPNANRYPDNCRLRKRCDNDFMTYADFGSTTRDSTCKCLPGYHFESTDQRLCVANRECDVGYGQTEYGTCRRCSLGSTYSNVKDNKQTCQAVTNCEKDKRCTLVLSNGTRDNICSSYKVKDPSKDCDKPPPVNGHSFDGSASELSGFAIAAIVLGVLAVIAVIIILIFYVVIKRRRTRACKDQIDPIHLERLASQITERSSREEPYRRKVLTAAIREIEDNINKQIWSLPQELFRNHFQDAKYELIVEKYKDKDHKYAINGYMQDWREWREEAGDAVPELFACLKKVKREDIIYKICSKFREAYPEVVIDAETQLENGVVSRRSKRQNDEGFLDILFPCCFSKSTITETEETEQVKFMLEDTKEAGAAPQTLEFEPHEKGDNSNDNGAMTPQEAGQAYRERPTPSAPVLDETGNIHIIIPMNRSVSYPVQASS